MAKDETNRHVRRLKKILNSTYDKTAEVQRRLEERFKRTGKGRYGRVLKMARRPTSEEYSRTIMIVGLGVILIGMLGFAIYITMDKGVPGLREFLGL